MYRVSSLPQITPCNDFPFYPRQLICSMLHQVGNEGSPLWAAATAVCSPCPWSCSRLVRVWGEHILFCTLAGNKSEFSAHRMWCVWEAVPFISASAMNSPGLHLERGKLLALIAASSSDLQSLSGGSFDLTKRLRSAARLLRQHLGRNPAVRLQT